MGKENTAMTKSEPNYPRLAILRAWIFQIFAHSWFYVAHYQSMFLGLQRPAIPRSKKLDRHETWMPRLGTQSALARPQNQASFHLSHFLLIAKVRNRFCSQAQKSACLFFFFITNKTEQRTQVQVFYAICLFSTRVINP